ncbi:putative flavoprotein involved in K+ transport [Kribbella amoyensis]|uniref:Putative flavoprotein involved in K+ transport n=1 Tax=Kribbella amoyensis TaxID=996641 RepID=A0A561BTN1_9ACTN|nr:NAD(P)-binding domain-containing protein [Kribbella amoyensis]TWD82172.1 putative flavoprotein involved in K+ transport [Kribbella amoyensis]
MHSIDTVVVGAGHAGLAVSRLLGLAGRDHVVLDRGRIGERWRTERWDSLRLLSPNWLTRLPGWPYGGADPDGFMTAARFVRHLERYATSFDAPVLGGTTVRELRAFGDGYLLITDRGTWRAANVVIATGPHAVPVVPAGLAATGLEVVTANRYRNPGQLAPGGVLVVGASSSGVQLADELNRAGRDVVLAVGRHTRLPRRYRGMDIFRWLDITGKLARTIDEVPDPVAARHEPSMQLVGTDSAPRDLDLVTLQDQGVRLVGHFARLEGTRARFRPDLAEQAAVADKRLTHLLDSIDWYAAWTGLGTEILPITRPRRLDVPAPVERLDLAREGIGTVLVATGYRPDTRWIRLPITGPDGAVRQRRGVTPAPGVYVVGQRFQYRRDSAFIDGARYDAADVVRHLTGSAAGSVGAEPAA